MDVPHSSTHVHIHLETNLWARKESKPSQTQPKCVGPTYRKWEGGFGKSKAVQCTCARHLSSSPSLTFVGPTPKSSHLIVLYTSSCKPFRTMQLSSCHLVNNHSHPHLNPLVQLLLGPIFNPLTITRLFWAIALLDLKIKKESFLQSSVLH